jgi:hypothetical protein
MSKLRYDGKYFQVGNDTPNLRQILGMNTIKSKSRSKIFRAAGFILGCYLVIMGIIAIAYPVSDTTIEKLGALTGILWGGIFLFFSFTGKSPVGTKANNQKSNAD